MREHHPAGQSDASVELTMFPHVETSARQVRRDTLAKAPRLSIENVSGKHDLLHLGHQNPHVLGGDTAALVQRSVPARTSCVIADALLLPMLQLLRLLG